MSQRLPSESLKFTKVWAKVPPKCLKGCPLSHLSSPRYGWPLSHLSSPRFEAWYHLSVSKVAPKLHTKRFVEGGGCHAPRNLSGCLTFGLRHLADSSQDGFRTWQLTPSKKNIKSRISSPGTTLFPYLPHLQRPP